MASGQEGKKTAVKCTVAQKELLVNLLLDRPRLVTNKLDPDFTALDRKNGWDEVASILNADGSGPTKTTIKWMKTWADTKKNVKAKAGSIAKARRKTGGGESSKVELTPLEERVIAEFFNSASITGEEGVVEAGLPLPSPVTSPLAPIIYLNGNGELEMEETEEVPISVEEGPEEPVEGPVEEQLVAMAEMAPPVMSNTRTLPDKKKRKRTQVTVSSLQETVQAAKKFSEGQSSAAAAQNRIAAALEQLVACQEKALANEENRNAIFARIADTFDKMLTKF